MRALVFSRFLKQLCFLGAARRPIEHSGSLERARDRALPRAARFIARRPRLPALCRLSTRRGALGSSARRSARGRHAAPDPAPAQHVRRPRCTAASARGRAARACSRRTRSRQLAARACFLPQVGSLAVLPMSQPCRSRNSRDIHHVHRAAQPRCNGGGSKHGAPAAQATRCWLRWCSLEERERDRQERAELQPCSSSSTAAAAAASSRAATAAA